MLEFYSVLALRPSTLPMQLDFDSAWRCRHFALTWALKWALTWALACALTLVLGACATAPSGPVVPATPVRPTAPPLPRAAEPPPPKINLSGFPLAYRQGYADGCASAKGAERKDADRFVSDGNYGMGWQDGIALCRKR